MFKKKLGQNVDHHEFFTVPSNAEPETRQLEYNNFGRHLLNFQVGMARTLGNGDFSYLEPIMALNEVMDLTFEVEFSSNQFAMDETFDDDFNVGNTFFNDLLASIKDLYGENSRTCARNGQLYVTDWLKFEWLHQSEQDHIQWINKNFVGNFGLTLEGVTDKEHMNT